MYRALLFDLDGTLAETDSRHLPVSSSPTRPLIRAALEKLGAATTQAPVTFTDAELIELLAS